MHRRRLNISRNIKNKPSKSVGLRNIRKCNKKTKKNTKNVLTKIYNCAILIISLKLMKNKNINYQKLVIFLVKNSNKKHFEITDFLFCKKNKKNQKKC